ncbi:unnamed protein product [Caenorhabditis bovis]|uniref:Uncharacterized protein n=1 Tax=Caenorhabditis bovis TaxID=2654633 RepID=A0A8S1EUL0_9PELO|nr:unnamed protein product [Caenorhabditis bovis]
MSSRLLQLFLVFALTSSCAAANGVVECDNLETKEIMGAQETMEETMEEAEETTMVEMEGRGITEEETMMGSDLESISTFLMIIFKVPVETMEDQEILETMEETMADLEMVMETTEVL